MKNNCQLLYNWDQIDPIEVAKRHNELVLEGLKIFERELDLTQEEIVLRLPLDEIPTSARRRMIDFVSSLPENGGECFVCHFLQEEKVELLYRKIGKIVEKSGNLEELHLSL